jgi:hypothetical protein
MAIPTKTPAEETYEKALGASKKISLTYVDSYEKAGLGLADLQEKVGGASKVDWVVDVASAQAGLTRELTKAYASAARELLR